MTLRVRPGQLEDVPLIAELIRGLARYENLEHEVVMTEEKLTDSLFGDRRYAETLIAEEEDGKPVGFALFFHNYSTFLAQPGIYLEDLFVLPEHRGGGAGRALLERLAQLAVERGCGRLEWAVLDWNTPSIRFYQKLGAKLRRQWILTRLTGAPLNRLARRRAATTTAR